MKNHAHTITRRFGAFGIIGIVLGLMLALAAPVLAADYTWTSTANQSSGYWTNGVLWGNTESDFPGSAANTPSAWLTNTVGTAGGWYTNVLNFTLANSIGTIVLSNSNNGQSWLVLTNATLNNDNFLLGSGGRLRVNNGGQFNNTTAFTLTGTNGAATINSGGTIIAAGGMTISPTAGDLNSLTINSGGSVFVTNASGNAQLFVGPAGGGRGTLTFNSGTLFVNQLISSNNFATAANLPSNSWFTAIGGTLITSNAANAVASRIVLPENENFNVNGTWIMLGGTNWVKSYSTGSSTTAGNLNGFSGSSIIVSNGAKMYSELARNFILDGPNALLLITGPGSVVSNKSLNMILSSGGTFTNDRVIIQDGGALVSSSGLSIQGTNNTVLVTGTGSTLTNAGLTVFGPNNFMIVSNHAIAQINGAIGDSASPNGGTIIVTGTGSVMNVTGQFNLGHFRGGMNNSLVINDGGIVSDSATILLGGRGGQAAGGAPCSNNTVTVADPGSRFAAGPLQIGGDGNGSAGNERTNNCFNGITVSNGAFLTSSSAQIGTASDPTAAFGGNNSNYVVVTGPGSVWTNSGVVNIGYTNMIGNYVSVTDGAKYVGGGAVTVGYGGTSNSLSVMGTATASSFSNNGLVTVGLIRGGFNTMTVTNASIWTAGLTIGGNTSSNNTVTIQDAASTWNFLGGALTVGSANGIGANGATGNVFNFISSTQLTNLGGVKLYDQNVSLFLTNRSLAASSSGISLGSPGLGGNSVTISNANVTATTASSVIGNGSSNNTLTLLANSTWTLGGNGLTIGGGASSGNVVTLNGGTVSSSLNPLNLFGSGAANAGNSLVITNGGQLITTGGFTTYATGSNNTVLVTGSGSVWSNTGQVYGGGGSADNRITIADHGSFVDGQTLSVGYAPATIMTVTDTGSVLRVNNSSGIQIGSGASDPNCSLIISNGGLGLVQGGLQVGVASSKNDSLIVTGPGSVLSNWSSATLSVGYSSGASNNLLVSQGGVVFSQAAQIGNTGFGNAATVTGSGSMWTNTGEIDVGYYLASQNSLTVSNGGRVFASTTYVGGGAAGANANSNTVTVTGPGSLLQLATGLNVAGFYSGVSGSNNSVRLLNGGILDANTLTIYAGSFGNTISNVGGVFQFSIPTPTISPNGFGNIAVTGGTIAFRNITNADVTSSQGAGALKNIQFAGANTFMLNSASNSTAASQTYTFEVVGSNPSNFAGLAMINGQTAYRNGGATIGATGALLVSNTIASFSSVVTNGGVAVLVNSTETFSGGLFNQGTVTNYNNNSFTGLLTMNNGTFVTAGGPAQFLTGNLNIQGTGTFDTSGGNLIVPTGGITNGNVFAKIGTGNLVMTGATAFAGEMQAIAGAVVLGNSFALSNSTVNVVSGVGSLVFSNNGAYTLGGLKGGAGAAVALTGSDNNPVALTVGNNGQNTTFGGSISGSGSITKIGAGTLVFSGPNSYSGDTYINAGQLVLADPSAAVNSSITVPNNNALAFSNATSFAIAGLTGSGNIGLVNVGGSGIGLTVSNTDNSLTYSGVMSGSGSLTKAGNGTFELTGNNTFNGTVDVTAGKLLVNGSLTGGGPLTLSADATLAGSGTVGRVVSGAGQVAPGNSPGLLTVNQLDPSAGMGFEFEFTQLTPNFGNLGAIGNDVLRITNATPFTVALGLSNTVNLVVTAPLTAGVINYLRGGFYSDSGAMFDPTINGATYNLFIDDGGPLAFVHTVAETTPWGTGRILEIGVWGKMIPEPQVVMFWLTGAATLYAARRRMRRQK